MTRHRAGLLAPLATVQLGLLLVWAAASPSAAPYAGWLLALLAAVALGAAALMDTEHRATSRVLAAGVGVVAATGVALASTIGLPGTSSRPLDAPAALLALAAATVVVLSAWPARPRAALREPYAS